MKNYYKKITDLKMNDRFKFLQYCTDVIFEVVNIDFKKDVLHIKVIEGVNARKGMIRKDILSDVVYLHDNKVLFC